MVNADRLARIRTALDQRLGWVHVAAESLYHRHNMSAVLRTCDAMGIHHVHLVERTFRPAKGASRGVERWMALHHHEGPERAIADIRARGMSLWVADLDESSVTPEELPLDRPVCLWFGTELTGVGRAARKAADGVVCVPMRGLAQSLNVSVAAALTIRPVAERARALGERARLDPAEREATWEAWLAREEASRTAIRARRQSS